MLLGFEAQRVMLLRAITIASGGVHAQAETNRMVSEKVSATMIAVGMMTLGRSPESVVRYYRSKANGVRRADTRPTTT
jgi:hypothetical protein